MLAIDLHCHILPGVDDGPRTLRGSLEHARAAVATGTGLMVATPHVNEDRFIAPLEIPAAVARLNEELAQEGISLDVRAGGEIALGRLAALSDEELESLRLGGGPFLLLESPFEVRAGRFEGLIDGAMDRGHRVLLAHPERCPAFQREPDRLAARGRRRVLVQLTAGSLTGSFGASVRRLSARFLADGLVHVIASDSHNHDQRPPGLDEPLRAIERGVPGIAGRAQWLTRDVPAAILSGEPIPEPEPLAAPASAA